MKLVNTESNLTIKQIISCLILISITSLVLKLYLVDFSIPVNSDNLEYALFAIAHTNGDFSQSSHRGMGWSYFVSIFFNFIDSDNFIDYSNTIRGLSIAISVSSISMMYLLGRKFFDGRYSLLLASLFAFEPHLNYNSGLGIAEPFFILSLIGAFYFILNKNSRFIIISLLLTGIVYWSRLNGFFAFFVISIIYFITMRKSPHFLRNYAIGVIIFLMVISPILIQRDAQFDDPFYSVYSGTLFSGDIETIFSEVGINETYSASNYIENNGFGSFIQTFILNGFYNTFNLLSILSFPYLFILIPFGILFSFRAFDQNPNFIKANWIFLLLSISFMILIISVVPERRFLFHILPFLMIFSVIPIQRVIEYGLSTFSFSRKQKDIFLLCVIIAIIILSGLFTLRYEKLDPMLENEKLDFSNFALNNLDGTVLRDFGGGLDYVTYLKMTNPSDNFKNYMINQNMDSGYQFNDISIPSQNTLNEFFINAEKNNVRYLITNEKQSNITPLIDQLYFKHASYPYLEKIFDSNDIGYKKLKLKVFEINYEKFHEINK